jgi:hypothetical protein
MAIRTKATAPRKVSKLRRSGFCRSWRTIAERQWSRSLETATMVESFVLRVFSRLPFVSHVLLTCCACSCSAPRRGPGCTLCSCMPKPGDELRPGNVNANVEWESAFENRWRLLGDFSEPGRMPGRYNRMLDCFNHRIWGSNLSSGSGMTGLAGS